MPPRIERAIVPRKVSRRPLEAPPAPAAPPTAPPPSEKLSGRTKTLDLGLFSGRKPYYVGLDQSLTAFGVAGYSPEDKSAFLWVYRTEARGVRRLLDLQMFVRGCFQQMGLRCGGEPGHVVMEGYAFSRQMGHALGECGAATKLALISALGYAKPVAYPTIPTTQQVKKFCTSNGNAKKDDMKLHVYKKWGVEVSDDNLADAYTMARMAAAIELPEHMDYQYERQVIGVLERHTEWPTLEVTRPTRSSTKAKRASSG